MLHLLPKGQLGSLLPLRGLEEEDDEDGCDETKGKVDICRRLAKIPSMSYADNTHKSTSATSDDQ